MSGQELIKRTVAPVDHSIKEQISLPQNLPNGVYTIRLSSGEELQTLRFTLNR